MSAYKPANIFEKLKNLNAKTCTQKVNKAARGLSSNYYRPPAPRKPVASHVLEKDFYTLYVTEPNTIEIMFKFAEVARPTMKAKFTEDGSKGKITYYSMDSFGYEKQVSNLPESLMHEVERVFHARTMY